jgi:hypothetical protein
VATKHRVQLIAKQVDEQCLVVWYDPEQASSPEKSARSALRALSPLRGDQ